MKYKLTDESIEFNGVTLFRIQALKAFSYVNEGDLGGFVESEENLSQNYTCWIAGNAKVYGDAKVFQSALVRDNAVVYDNAKIFHSATICNNAKVYENAKVFHSAIVKNMAVICDNASVYGSATVCDIALVCDDAEVYGESIVGSNAKIIKESKIWKNTKIFSGIHAEEIPEILTKEAKERLKEVDIEERLKRAARELITKEDKMPKNLTKARKELKRAREILSREEVLEGAVDLW